MSKDSVLLPTPALGAHIPITSFSCRNSGYIITFPPLSIIDYRIIAEEGE
jgi:hypothetical protein